ncbi:Rho termination factor N-terminal domain-containing protein [Paenibacillus ihumii]|uniref:Rho termination factor N-terminal domain-containing protein n=1 Tax=Paenibacillus ihumii TaxID=687436 RepID=UPI0006D7A558|nr:Rho termination factor N-terminal domain-containing protein [Paenibacillus ihumii]
MEDYNEMLEQMNIQHAIIGDVTTSLPDILQDLTKVRLSSLASACNLPGRSKMKKQELIEALTAYMTDAEHLQSALLITDALEWQLFESLLRQPVLQNNLILIEHYWYLMNHGLVFTYFSEGQLYIVMPDEIRDAYAQLDHADFHNKRTGIQLVHEYILAMTHLYGVIEPDKFIEIYNGQNSEPLEQERFKELFEMLASREQNYTMAGGYIVDGYLSAEESREELEELLSQINDKPQYVPKREDLLKYADDDYFEMTPQLTKLRAYIQKEICRDAEMVEYLIDDIQLACTMQAAPGDLIHEFERRGLKFQSMEQADIVVALMNDVYNHTRLWIYRGHTPFEMNRIAGNVELRSAHRQLSPLSKSQVSVTKIGRNEPCPCNSGFKYKKCCGK